MVAARPKYASSKLAGFVVTLRGPTVPFHATYHAIVAILAEAFTADFAVSGRQDL